MQPERLLLKVPEVAIALGISRAKAYELANIPMEYGGLPVVRIGKSVRVPRAALQQWIDQQWQGGQS